jgi:hypothetical protein
MVLTEGFLQAMPPEERAKLGKAGMTKAEAQARFAVGQEKELQDQVRSHLDRHEIYYDDDRMDKKTSGRRGRADFRCCVRGRWLSLECKSETGTLTTEQVEQAARLRKSGGKFAVVFSLRDAINAIAAVESL